MIHIELDAENEILSLSYDNEVGFSTGTFDEWLGARWENGAVNLPYTQQQALADIAISLIYTVRHMPELYK